MHEQPTAYKRLAELFRWLVAEVRAAQNSAHRAFAARIPMRLHVEMLPPRLMFSATVSATTLEDTSLVFSPANGYSITVGGSADQVELQSTHGTLTLAKTSGLSFQIGNGTNNTTVEFTGSISSMNAALNGLVFAPTTGYTGSASVAVTAYSPGLLGLGILGSSTTDTIAITVKSPPPPVDQAPAIQPPGPQTTPEGTPLVLSGASAITVSDSDADGYAEQITLNATGGTLSLSGTTGLTFGPGSNASSMTFTGTLANLDAALNGLTYTPSALYYGTGGITASINDLGNSGTGGPKTATASIAIDVTEVNQPPTLTLPTSQTGAENAQVVFSSANGDPIAAGDIDANGGQEQISLSTTVGSLTLAGTTGLAFVSGGDGASSMTIQGTLANINAALDGLALTPGNGYTGAITLNAAVNDLGNSGAGGQLTASGSVSINVVSSIVVTTASDVVDGNTSSVSALLSDEGTDGKISLREAILAANNTPGVHEIDFDIAGGGVQTISVATPLPGITNSVIINGTTQPGYNGSPLIDLKGNAAPAGTIGLSVETSNCTFEGLAIDGFTGNGIDVLPVGANNITIQGNYVGLTAYGVANFNGDGIVLANSADDTVGGTTAAQRNVISGNYYEGVHIFGPGSTGDVISGNYIGTNPVGVSAIPNGGIGIFIDGASGDTIGLAAAGGGNVISGNGGYGIEVGGSSPSGNVIQGNLIGVNVSGTGGLANGNDGIYLDAATGTTIGGTSTADRNVISGNNNAANTADGVWIVSGASNIVQGNYIGVDASGDAAMANYSDGVLIQNSPGNQIGGAAAGAGNVISGNGNYGLEIDGLSATGNFVQGNFIGTSADASAGITNGNDGIFLSDTTGNTIGGTAAGAGNVIGGNTNIVNSADGIWIDTGSFNTVQGNFIGTNASGATGLGNNNYGVEIESSSNNVIGGGAAGAGNVIAFNNKGISVWGTGATGNAIRGNSIFSNTTIGIDLGDDGVTANTGTTNSSLANDGMNFPVFTSVALTGSTLTVAGYIGTAPGQTAFAGAQIDLFKSDNSMSNGQGQIYLGTLTADGSGNFTGSLTVSGLLVGDKITATATDNNGDTSEFSANAAVQVFNQPPAIHAPSTASTGENTPLFFSADRDNAITITDDDADGSVEQTTLSVPSGTLTLAETAGLTFLNGTTDGSKLLTFTGTLSAMNAALDGLLFTPAQDFGGSFSLSLSVDDLGNTGAGGQQTKNADIVMTVSPVANTPSVSDASTNENAQTAGGLVITPSALDGSAQGYYQISQITDGTVFLNDGVTPVGEGQFITFAQGAAGLKFTPATDYFGSGSFSVQTASSPSPTNLVGSPVTATIAVARYPIPVAHDPSVTGSTTIENIQTSTGLVITPSALDDPNATWFQITNIVGGTLFQNDGVTPINSGDFITAADGMAGLKFTPASNSTAPGGFAVQASTTDDASGLGGNIISATIAVATPVAPVNSVPSPQAGSEDTPVVFSPANGNAIVISDPGSDGSAEQVSLSTANGTLTLATTTGITLTSGTGTADASVTLTGSLANINAALDGLTFTPSVHYVGSATMQVVTRDLSAAGIANSLAVASNVAITVAAPVAPPPPPSGTQVQPVELSNVPASPISSVPAAPPSGVPSLSPPPAATGGPINSSAGIPATSDSEPTPSSADAAATTPGRTPSVPTSLANPAGAVAAPIIARTSTLRSVDVELTAPASVVRNNDLELSAQDAITLGRGQRIVMELDNPLADEQARANGIFALTNHNSRGISDNAPTALAANSQLWRDLDQMQEQATSQRKMRVIAGAASLASVGVSVMYFMWAVRAGSVLSSLLSSMPAWNLVDPLPILDQVAVLRRRKGGGDGDEEDETLESMVDGARTPV